MKVLQFTAILNPPFGGIGNYVDFSLDDDFGEKGGGDLIKFFEQVLSVIVNLELHGAEITGAEDGIVPVKYKDYVKQTITVLVPLPDASIVLATAVIDVELGQVTISDLI